MAEKIFIHSSGRRGAGRGLGALMCGVLALGLLALGALSPAANAAPGAAQARQATTMSATVEAAAGVPEVLPAKNRTCGWGLRTRYHSCDLARALALIYLQDGYPTQLYDVYSPNSGKYYDFTCWGSGNVTCQSNRGRVYMKTWQLPDLTACGSDYYGQDIVAWGNASCDFALNTGAAWYEQQSSTVRNVYEPSDGRYYRMRCYGNGSSVVCYNNRDWVVIE